MDVKTHGCPMGWIDAQIENGYRDKNIDVKELMDK